MGGLFRHYVRVFFRSHFRPINPQVAKEWERKTSYLYLFFAWSTLVFSIYAIKKSGIIVNDSVIDPYENMKKFGTTDKYTVISFDGRGVKKEVYSYKELEEKTES